MTRIAGDSPAAACCDRASPNFVVASASACSLLRASASPSAAWRANASFHAATAPVPTSSTRAEIVSTSRVARCSNAPVNCASVASSCCATPSFAARCCAIASVHSVATLSVWSYYGTTVFFELVRAGWAACF